MVEGLIQRFLIIMGFGWIALIALHVWRQERKAMLKIASSGTITGINAN